LNKSLQRFSITNYTTIVLLYISYQCLQILFLNVSWTFKSHEISCWFLLLIFLISSANNSLDNDEIMWMHYLLNKWMQRVLCSQWTWTEMNVIWCIALSVLNMLQVYLNHHDTSSMLKSWSYLRWRCLLLDWAWFILTD